MNTDSFLTKKNDKRETNQNVLVELNSADSLQRLEVYGIGSVFASRIIRYRKLLGGYYSVSQLKEVYGMREENYQTIAKFFTVDPSKINTLNINFATIQELGRHPYIGYKAAKRIYKLKDQVGKFQSADNLKSVISADSLIRIVPYLKFGL